MKNSFCRMWWTPLCPIRHGNFLSDVTYNFRYSRIKWGIVGISGTLVPDSTPSCRFWNGPLCACAKRKYANPSTTLGSGRVTKVQRYLSYLNSHKVMWYHFLHQGKTCARIRSRIEALGSNTRDIGVIFVPAVLFLPALTLCRILYCVYQYYSIPPSN